MGCDIHAVYEQHDDELGWVGLHDYPYGREQGQLRSRNYQLFAHIAQVRGEDPTGHQPRGMPDDASDLSRLRAAEMGVDGHTHSWLTVEEMTKALLAVHATPEEIAKRAKHLLASGEDTVKRDADRIATGSEENYDNRPERVVFWFDN